MGLNGSRSATWESMVYTLLNVLQWSESRANDLANAKRVQICRRKIQVLDQMTVYPTCSEHFLGHAEPTRRAGFPPVKWYRLCEHLRNPCNLYGVRSTFPKPRTALREALLDAEIRSPSAVIER